MKYEKLVDLLNDHAEWVVNLDKSKDPLEILETQEILNYKTFGDVRDYGRFQNEK